MSAQFSARGRAEVVPSRRSGYGSLISSQGSPPSPALACPRIEFAAAIPLRRVGLAAALSFYSGDRDLCGAGVRPVLVLTHDAFVPLELDDVRRRRWHFRLDGRLIRRRARPRLRQLGGLRGACGGLRLQDPGRLLRAVNRRGGGQVLWADSGRRLHSRLLPLQDLRYGLGAEDRRRYGRLDSFIHGRNLMCCYAGPTAAIGKLRGELISAGTICPCGAYVNDFL